MNPHDYCQQRAASSGSSFYYSFRFLQAKRRRAITALYAFCREVDDIVDECEDRHQAHTQLDDWQEQVQRLYRNQATHPVTLALYDALSHFQLQREHLLEIIAGMRMDLEQDRYNDFEALRSYCHRVAGVVGLLAAEIFGYRDARTQDYAAELGLALQLTNIVRDVGEDGRRGRIYLPLEDLRRFNVSEQDILTPRYSDNFYSLMQFQFQRAAHHYQQALASLPKIDRKRQRPGLIMAAIYHRLLQQIRTDGFRVLDRRTTLTPQHKIWLAVITWLRRS